MKKTFTLTTAAMLILVTVACGGMDPETDPALSFGEDQASLGTALPRGGLLPKTNNGGTTMPTKCKIYVDEDTNDTFYKTTVNLRQGEYAVRASVQLRTNHPGCSLSLAQEAPDSNMLGHFHDFSYAQLYEKHKGGVRAWQDAGDIDGAYENGQYIGTYAVYDTFFPQPGSTSVYISQFVHCTCEGTGMAPATVRLEWTINRSN